AGTLPPRPCAAGTRRHGSGREPRLPGGTPVLRTGRGTCGGRSGDAHGMDPQALGDLVARERPKLLFTVPTFQNPTGRTLPAARRAAVAEIAARCGLWIVEDDPYGELRYEGERVPWISAHPGAEDRT